MPPTPVTSVAVTDNEHDATLPVQPQSSTGIASTLTPHHSDGPRTNNGNDGNDDVSEVLRSVAMQLRRVQAERTPAALSHLYTSSVNRDNTGHDALSARAVRSEQNVKGVHDQQAQTARADRTDATRSMILQNTTIRTARALLSSGQVHHADTPETNHIEAVCEDVSNVDAASITAETIPTTRTQSVVWQLDVRAALQQQQQPPYNNNNMSYTGHTRLGWSSIASKATRQARPVVFTSVPSTAHHTSEEGNTSKAIPTSQFSPCVVLNDVCSIDTQYTDEWVTSFAQRVLRALLHTLTDTTLTTRSQGSSARGAATVYHVFARKDCSTVASNDTSPCERTECEARRSLPWCYIAWRRAWERAEQKVLSHNSASAAAAVHSTTSLVHTQPHRTYSGLTVHDKYVIVCDEEEEKGEDIDVGLCIQLPTGQRVVPVPPLWSFLYDHLTKPNTTHSHTTSSHSSEVVRAGLSARAKAVATSKTNGAMSGWGARRSRSSTHHQNNDSFTAAAWTGSLSAAQREALSRIPLTRGSCMTSAEALVKPTHADPALLPTTTITISTTSPMCAPDPCASAADTMDYVSVAQECLRMTRDAMGRTYQAIEESVAAQLVRCPLRLYTLAELDGVEGE